MKRQSVYQQTLGRPYLRSAMIQGLMHDLDMARKSGNQGWIKAITNDLHALGEGDYLEADHGEAPKGAIW